MRQKLRAMIAARRDPHFFIVARTDAVAVTDLDDAIERLTSYAAVGADGLYVDAPESVEQLREISRRLKPLGLPLLSTWPARARARIRPCEKSTSSVSTTRFCPIEPLLAMHKAVKETMETFMQNGCSTNAIADRLTPFDEFNEFVGLSEMVERQNRFV